MPCETGPGARALDKGYDQAVKKVGQRWRKHRAGCDDVDGFVADILDDLDALEAKSNRGSAAPQRVCRILGRLDGAFAALDDLQGRCLGRCFLRGEVVGALAAAAYCDLALAGAALDAERFVRGPVNTCGLGYEVSCDATFLGDTLTYERPAGGCEPYTSGGFAAAWDATRSRACAYERRDEPDG